MILTSGNDEILKSTIDLILILELLKDLTDPKDYSNIPSFWSVSHKLHPHKTMKQHGKQSPF